MNEFDYEVMQRKRIASSARHRVNGVKSKKCSLPSDHMTQKQWKERNGSVMSYNMNQPMKWAEFKAMPSDIKKEYIEGLIEKHGATGGSIAEMLGISPSAFSHHVSDANLGVKFESARRSKEKRIAWQRFIGDNSLAVPHPVDVVELPVMEATTNALSYESTKTSGFSEDSHEQNERDVMPEEQKRGMQMNRFSLSFSGNIDIEMVSNSLRYIIGNGTNAELKIECIMAT